MITTLKICVVASLGFVVGCPLVPAPGPEAVLEGTWSITPADPADFEGFTYEARFDSSGNLVQITGTRPDGATVSLDIDNATTTVDGTDVSISIPLMTGASVFSGTLSGDQNTIVGSITDEIDLGNFEASLPGGELTLERVIDGGGGSTPQQISMRFAFSDGASGWSADFADYPEGEDEFYNLLAEIRELPEELGIDGTGFFIRGINRSDDLFMYLKRALGPSDGIVANARYAVTFNISVASNAPSDCGGIGGPPGEAVWLKAGASTAEPTPVVDESGTLRMNVDVGSQSNGGTAASVVDVIANGVPCDDSGITPYVLLDRAHVHDVNVEADENGNLWLIVGTDSGFESLTALYYVSIEATLDPVSN